MRRYGILAAAVVMGLCSAVQAADTEKAMADVSAKAKNSLAIMTLKVKDANSMVAGQAVCISADGVFVTTVLDPSMRKDSIDDLKLILPGKEGKSIGAKFLGVDPSTGLGFVQATEKAELTPVDFQPEAKLVPGQQVISIGIMGGDANRSTYLGVAYVSAVLRVPGPIVYVTGGKLTNLCSPVFSSDGKAIGLVVRQLPLSYSTDTQQGTLNLPLRGEEETSFFLPSDEFYQAVRKENIPKENEIRRLPWLGINKFEPVNEETAGIRGIKDLLPAISVDQVIKAQPADNAGIKDADIIVGVDGKPFEKLANQSFVVQNFMRQVMKFQIGQKVKLSVISGAEKTPHEVTLTVGPMPTLPAEANRLFDQALGMIVREKVPLDRDLMKDVSTADGLIVMQVADKSPAQEKGIGANDLIVAINDTPVNLCAKYKELTEKALGANPPQTLKLTIYRAGSKVATPVIFTPRPAK